MTNEVLAIGLQGMQSDAARLDQIAMNMANAMTPGYKRGQAVVAPVAGSFATHMAAVTDEATAPLHAAVQLAVDTRAGTLKATGRNLDLAIDGAGYFEVVTDTGPAYTRQGNFRVDARGRLVTAQGYPVMGTGGEITVGAAQPSIAATGEVTNGVAGSVPLGQLKVVAFDPSVPMAPMGDGLLAPGSGMKTVSDTQLRIRQGFLENSNVDSAQEMTQLVQAMRHFETMQKVVQGYDDMMGTAIRKLGETS